MVEHEKARVVTNRYLIGDYFLLSLSTKISQEVLPGNFITVHIDEKTESSFMVCFADKKEGSVKVIYSKADKRTAKYLKPKAPGDLIDISGPYGDDITVPRDAESILLVSNGRQLPETSFLASKLKGKRVFSVIAGAEQEVILSENLLLHFNSKVYVSKDTGTYNCDKDEIFCGTIRKVMENKINHIFVAGPHMMIETVKTLAKRRAIPVTAFVEEKVNHGVALAVEEGPQKIILASASPYRVKAFSFLGLDFVNEGSGFDECAKARPKDPRDLVSFLAQGKAELVAKKYKKGIVVGFDSVGYFKGKILEKPKTLEEDQQRLRLLSGNTMEFYTGVYVKNVLNKQVAQRVVKNQVKFRNFSEQEIQKYFAQDPGFKTYAPGFNPVETYGASFVKEINGSYNNWLHAIPLENVVEMLFEVGYRL